MLKDRPGDELTAGLYAMLAQAQAKGGDIAGTQESIKGISDAPAGDGLNDARHAEAHTAIAAAQARAGDRQAYRDSLAAARRLTKDFRPPYERNTLVRIARTQAEAGDYEAATATVNTLDPTERAHFPDLVLTAQVKRGDVSPARALAVELRVRELAAAGRLEDARAWVESLPSAADRAQACRTVAMQLMPTPMRP